MESVFDKFGVNDRLKIHQESLRRLRISNMQSKEWLYENLIRSQSKAKIDLSVAIEYVIIRVHSSLIGEIKSIALNRANSELQELLKNYRIEYYLLNEVSVPLIDLVPLNSPEYTNSYLKALGNYFELIFLPPSRINSDSESISNPEAGFWYAGEMLDLTLDTLSYEFYTYKDLHIENIIPQFRRISYSIEPFLLKNYYVRPVEDEFIKWFITKQARLARYKYLEAIIERRDRDIYPSEDIQTPVVTKDDLHEYSQLEYERNEAIHKKIIQKRSSDVESSINEPIQPRINNPVNSAAIIEKLTSPAHIALQPEINNPVNSATDVEKLTHPQIALYYHYTQQRITPNNASDIAAKYGKTSITSGQKLEETYKQLDSEPIRIAKGKNRVRDIEAVLPLLTGSAKAMADEELDKAKANNMK